jgi:hypothetical protein
VDKDDRRLASLCDDQVRMGSHQEKKYSGDEARVHATARWREPATAIAVWCHDAPVNAHAPLTTTTFAVVSITIPFFAFAVV